MTLRIRDIRLQIDLHNSIREQEKEERGPGLRAVTTVATVLPVFHT